MGCDSRLYQRQDGSGYHQVSLSEIPLAEPPAGMTSNLIDPPSLAPAIVVVNVVMMTWATIFVTIRLFANTQAKRHLRVEDCKA